MLCHFPSLQTVACGLSEAFSALTASPALVVSYLPHPQFALMYRAMEAALCHLGTAISAIYTTASIYQSTEAVHASALRDMGGLHKPLRWDSP